MLSKYKVVVIAYKNVDTRIVEKISKYSVRDIETLSELNNITTFCGKGFNMNDRICIYLGWFKDDAKNRIKSGYKVSILELPFKASGGKVELIEFLDAAYEEDLVVLGKVDV